MKKISQLTIYTLFLIVIGITFVYAADQNKVSNPKIICDPASLEIGGSSDCSFVATVNDGPGMYAIVTNVYLEDLQLDGTPQNAITSGWGKGVVDVEYLTTGQSFTKLHTSDGTTGVKCGAEFNKTGEFCALFYSTNGTASLKKNVASGKDYTVIGTYKVKLVGNDQNYLRCGKICIYASRYNNDKDDRVVVSSSKKDCAEIEVLSDTNPDTGSFASYAILAAGAFIAICAVLVANKNNKFYRV